MSAARYQGVELPKLQKFYKAAIMSQRKRHHLGLYETAVEAARVYDEACIILVSWQHQQILQAVDVMLCCSACVTCELSCCASSPVSSTAVANAALAST